MVVTTVDDSNIEECLDCLNRIQVTVNHGFSESSIELCLNVYQASIEKFSRWKQNNHPEKKITECYIEATTKSIQILRGSGKFRNHDIDARQRTFIARLIEMEDYKQSELICWKLFQSLKKRLKSKKKGTILSSQSLVSYYDDDDAMPNHKLIIYSIDFAETNDGNVFQYINLMTLYLQTVQLSYKKSNKIIGSEDLLMLLDVKNSGFLKVLSQQKAEIKVPCFNLLIKVFNSFIYLPTLPRILKTLLILKCLQIIVRNRDIIPNVTSIPSNNWFAEFINDVQLLTNSDQVKIYKYINKDLYLLVSEYLHDGKINDYLQFDLGAMLQLLTKINSVKTNNSILDTCDWNIFIVSLRNTVIKKNNMDKLLHLIMNNSAIKKPSIDVAFNEFDIAVLKSDAFLKRLLSSVKIILGKTYTFGIQSLFVIKVLNLFSVFFNTNSNGRLTKRLHLSILDIITIYTKDLIETLPADYDFVINNLDTLADVTKKCGQVKRFRNISNLYYNIGLKLIKIGSDYANFPVDSLTDNIKNCIKIEHIICLADASKENLDQYESKLQKVVSILIKYSQQKLSVNMIFEFFKLCLDSSGFSDTCLKLRSSFSATTGLLLRCLLLNINNESVSIISGLCSHIPTSLRACIFLCLIKVVQTLKLENKKSNIAGILFSAFITDKDPLLYFLCYVEYLSIPSLQLDSIQKISEPSSVLVTGSVVSEYEMLILSVLKFKLFTRNNMEHKNPKLIIESFNLFLEWLNQENSYSLISKSVVLSEFESANFLSMVSYFQYYGLKPQLSVILSKYSFCRSSLLEKNIDLALKMMYESVRGYISLGFSKVVQKDIKYLEQFLKQKRSHFQESDQLINSLRVLLLKLEYYLMINNLNSAQSTMENILMFVGDHPESFSTSILDFINAHNINDNHISLMICYSKLSYLMANLKFLLGLFEDSVFDLRRSVRIILVIVKKLSKGISSTSTTEILMWQASGLLIQYYQLFIKINLHYGFSKDCEFYIKELKKIVFESDYLPVHQLHSSFLMLDYALLSNKTKMINECFDMSQSLHSSMVNDFVDKETEILNDCACVKYYGNKDNGTKVHEYYVKLCHEISYLNKQSNRGIDIDNPLLSIYSNLGPREISKYNRIQLQIENLIVSNLDNDNIRKFDYLNLLKRVGTKKYDVSLDCIASAKQHLLNAKKYLASDPVLAVLQDSAISIPSFDDDDLVASTNEKLQVGDTATKPVQELILSRDAVLNGKSDFITCSSNIELYEISYIFTYSISLLSAISHLTIESPNSQGQILNKMFYLSEVPRQAPFKYERRLSRYEENTKELVPQPKFVSDTSEDFSIDGISKEIEQYLPENWDVITIDICPYTGDLLLSKIDSNKPSPFVVRLPLNRFSSRDVSEDSISFKDAKNEFLEIISKNNESTKFSRTNKIDDIESKKNWWRARYKLNAKLEKLLKDVEFCWLGGFRGMFTQHKDEISTPEIINKFKTKFIKIIEDNLPSRKQMRQISSKLQRSHSVSGNFHHSRFSAKVLNAQNFKGISPPDIAIDDSVILLFLTLGDPDKLKDTELLEDLIYFVLDILSFHGEENAYDEIDIDQIYIDVEALLRSCYFEAQATKNKIRHASTAHTVLVVGKTCQNLPWESLPCLEKCSVSRMPSLKLLLESLKNHRPKDRARMELDISKPGYYILNPGQDLTRTQDAFEEKLKQNLTSWTARVGEPPTESEYLDGLIHSDLFIYIGHGGGEHYVRNSKLKKIPYLEQNTLKKDCAAALLLGCSSGSLSDNGQLEPNGTVFSYLIAGSPMILANLWDVTDKDIDKFSISMFEQWGLFSTEESAESKDERNGYNICEAVANSRKVCLLKYLNGAAPVIYGLPFYIKK
ncbi:separase [Saccharomycopsis crataegensis]|uniref:separase n=1 Tax=Saccharomycopsis crataegensis TaxID=43959 RepID=A0AAV5QMI2_9ASCO|nr:separase [Saccharomycopsis crataegensis]